MATKSTAERAIPATTPPPAYSSSEEMPFAGQKLHDLAQHTAILLNQSPRASFVNTYREHQDHQEDVNEAFSPINLRINTSITIRQSNNLICLTANTTEHANSIARAVVEAIYENSSGQCGIPMIDEDGRPRPIDIEVDASMTIEGAGNVIGSEHVISELLHSRGQGRKRGADTVELGSPAKRRRNSS